MDIQQVRDNLESLPEEIEVSEKEYLEARAQLNYMKDLSKRVLAKLMAEHSGSVAEKERLALSSVQYGIHLQGVKSQEVLVAEKASRFHKLANLFEAMRSLNKNV